MPRHAAMLCLASTILLATPAIAQIAPTGEPVIVFPPAAGYEAETPIHFGTLTAPVPAALSGASGSSETTVGTSPLRNITLPYGFGAPAGSPARAMPITDMQQPRE